MTVALCLLTWNELEGCKKDIPQIDRAQFDQIFCLDGGSSDGTVEYVKSQGIDVYLQKRKGLNQAHKEAVSLCTCDAIIFFHPKGTIPVEDTYRFREYFKNGYELIVASRMMKESVNEEDIHIIRPRKWFCLLLALTAKTLFKREGNTVWDSLHGFRGITKEAFLRMNISDMSPSIDIETLCRSYKFRMQRIEFPTKESKRMAGSSHFKALPAGSILLKYILWETFRKN